MAGRGVFVRFPPQHRTKRRFAPVLGGSVHADTSFALEFDGNLKADVPIPTEWLASVYVDGLLALEMLTGNRADAKLGIEAVGSFLGVAQIPTEWSAPQTSLSLVPTEWLTGTHQDRNTPLESLAGGLGAAALPVEWTAGASGSTALAVEWRGNLALAAGAYPTEVTATISLSPALSNEWLASAIENRSLPLEHISGVRDDALIPLEWGGQVVINEDAVLPLEFGGTIQPQTLSYPVEITTAVSASSYQPAEWLAAGELNYSLPAEWLGGVRKDALIPIEWAGQLVINEDATLPLEFVGTIQPQTASLPVEWLWTPAAQSIAVPIEWLAVQRQDVGAPIESSGTLAANIAGLPLSWTASVLASATLPPEWLQSVAYAAPLPIAPDAGLRNDIKLPIEWQGQLILNQDANLPLDFFGTIQPATVSYPVEWQHGLSQGAILPLDQTAASSVSRALQLEFPGAPKTDASLALEPSAAFQASGALDMEWTALPRTDAAISTEWLISAARSDTSFAIEHPGGVGAALSYPVSSIGISLALAVLSLESSAPITAQDASLAFEFVQSFLFSAQAGSMPVETLLGVGQSDSLPIEIFGKLAGYLSRLVSLFADVRRISMAPDVRILSPLSDIRMVGVYPDDSPMSQTQLLFFSVAGPLDNDAYTFDFANAQHPWLTTGDTITGTPTVVIKRSDGQASDMIIGSGGKSLNAAGTQFTVWLTGGTAGLTYTIEVTVATAAGRTATKSASVLVVATRS